MVAAQGLYVVLSARDRRAFLTLGGVAVAGFPFWWADVVLRNRFDVGVGGGGRRLGSPASVGRYLWSVAGDFSSHAHVWAACLLVLAVVGAVLLVRRNVLVDRGVATAAENGVYGPEGAWLIEGHGVDPDTVVDNLPHATFGGSDAQLAAGIAYLQREIKAHPVPVPPAPAYPNKAKP